MSGKNGEDTSGEAAWMNAYHDPVAALYTFSSCLALEDLDSDGDYKFLAGDLGSGQQDMRLRIYKGTQLTHEIPLINMPTAVCTFMMDTSEPAVAVASDTFVYIYKTTKPYFKFSLPLLEVNSEEADLWKQLKQDAIDATMLRDGLEKISADAGGLPLTTCSLKLLQLEPEELQPYANVFKQMPLRRQTVVTAMTTLHKSYAEDNAASCLVIGTENKDVYILDPAAFTFLTKLQLESVPIFISASGVYDVEFLLSVGCRDACIYTTQSGRVKFNQFALGSQPCGLLKLEKNIVVGCMDNTLNCYSQKGRRLWCVQLPDVITAMELMDYRIRNFKAVLVALKNKEVRIYRDRFLVNSIKMEDAIVAMRFGQFGRENGALIAVGMGGSLSVKILRRSVTFESKEIKTSSSQAQPDKINIPKKTKIYIDQATREKENSVLMHQCFQRDLLMLRLQAARSYLKAVSSRLAPITSGLDGSLRISAQVQGIGPVFKLTVSLQNTSPSDPAIELYIVFMCDETLYMISRKFIKLPMLVPSLSYDFTTMVECLSDYGRTDTVKALVFKKGNPVALITAVIDMPASESLVV